MPRSCSFQAIFVQLTRCWGPTFSPMEDRPKNPVPIVKVGARLVPNPAAPWLHGALTTTRYASTAAA